MVLYVLYIPDLPYCAVARLIEHCCFNSTPDLFNGQTANYAVKPPKVIESTTNVKKANWSATTETTLFYYSGNSITGQV